VVLLTKARPLARQAMVRAAGPSTRMPAHQRQLTGSWARLGRAFCGPGMMRVSRPGVRGMPRS
jgi:hypothetical protein